jgi:Arc/MetJ family transcription regulator
MIGNCTPPDVWLTMISPAVEHLMLNMITSRIMRTTVDIDDPILREVRAIHQREGRSMGAVVSELLADALARKRASHTRAPFRWTARAMHARVDLADKDALYSLLDGDRS